MNPYFQPQNNLVTVRNELEAMNYPVAFGNSITFKDETAPYVYTKTMGTSPFDQPVFVKYRLVREEPQEAKSEPLESDAKYVQIDDFKTLTEAVRALQGEVDALKNKRPTKKKEVIEDDSE